MDFAGAWKPVKHGDRDFRSCDSDLRPRDRDLRPRDRDDRDRGSYIILLTGKGFELTG